MTIPCSKHWVLFLVCLAFACQPADFPLGIGQSDSDTAGQQIPEFSDATAELKLSAIIPTSPTARIVPDDVQRVEVQVSWAGGETPVVEMSRTGRTSFSVVIGNLPANTECTVRAWALGAQSELLYEAEATNVVFAPDVQTNLVLNLIAADHGAHEGAAPRIIAVRRPATPVQTGNIVDLEFTIGDADDTELTYELQSSSGGTFDPESGQIALTEGMATLKVQYTAPTVAGPTPITLNVTDAAGLASSFSFTLNVQAEPIDPDPTQVDTLVNFPPVIESIIATYTLVGIRLEAVTSDDGPASELAYRWLGQGGIIGTRNPVTVPASGGILTITLIVTDGQEGSSSLSFELNTANTQLWHLPIENQPPVVVTAVQSRNDVSYGDIVELTLHATDPDGDTLAAEWSTTLGSLDGFSSETQGDNTVFQARWNADVTAGTAYVTVKVFDPRQAWVAYVFPINQVLGRVNLVADAGPDRTALIGRAVLLDGTGSTSEDGAILNYEWTQVNGPPSIIETPDAATTLVWPSAVGTCRYRLTITNINNTAVDDVYVFASDPLEFMFEDASITDAGIIHFLNKIDRRIQRYDLANWEWLPPFETGIDVRCMAAAPEGDQVYVGYEGGRMDVIDTSTGERTFFANAPASVYTMAVADTYLFTIDPTGAWETFSLYSRANGARTDAVEWRNNSKGIAYSRTLHRLFTFRDGSSPNDIIRTDVNLETGKFGTHADSPYHGDYSFIHPMRLFPDENRIAVASGVIFSTSDLQYAGSLGMSYVDMTFHGKMPYIIKKIGTNTELTIMEENFAVREVRSYTGEPLRIFCTGDNMMLVTKRGTRLIGIEAVTPAE